MSENKRLLKNIRYDRIVIIILYVFWEVSRESENRYRTNWRTDLSLYQLVFLRNCRSSKWGSVFRKKLISLYHFNVNKPDLILHVAAFRVLTNEINEVKFNWSTLKDWSKGTRSEYFTEFFHRRKDFKIYKFSYRKGDSDTLSPK